MLTYRSKFFGGGTSGGSGPITVTGPIQATTVRAVAPATVTITNATNATPIIVTAVAHGLVTGDAISISGITGNTNANGFFKITKLSADTFSLQNYSTGADIAGNGAYGGTPVAVTGIVQAQRVLAGDGTAAAPSVGNGTAGWGLSFPSGVPVFYAVSAEKFRFTTGTGGVPFLSMSGGAGTQIGLGTNTLLTNAGADTLQLGAANAASPVAQTLQAQGARGGTDTDVAGGNLTIRPGAGTGAATGASIIFQTPTAIGSSFTQQTQTTRLTINSGSVSVTSVPFYNSGMLPNSTDAAGIGTASALWSSLYLSRATLGSKTKAITDGSATAFASFTQGDGVALSGEIIYNITAVKGTDVQVLAGRLRFAATRVGSTYVGSVSEIGTQTTAVSTGTLTGSISIAGAGGVQTLSANFDTSFASPDTFVINYRFDSPNASLSITPG